MLCFTLKKQTIMTKLEQATQKVLMQEQATSAVATQLTPYYDLFNRCTKAVIVELDSDKTTVETEEVRKVVNFLNGYATLIHKVISNPQLQEAVIDFVIQLEEEGPTSKPSPLKEA